jgi:hypothetical protein
VQTKSNVNSINKLCKIKCLLHNEHNICPDTHFKVRDQKKDVLYKWAQFYVLSGHVMAQGAHLTQKIKTNTVFNKVGAVSYQNWDNNKVAE